MAWLILAMAGIWFAAPTTALAPGAPAVIPDSAFAPVNIAPRPPVIVDTFPVATPGPRGHGDVAEAPVIVIPRPTASSTRARVGDGALRGEASWYCKAGVSVCHYQYPDGPGFDGYAAAGPALRQAIGPGWRNSIVSVDGVRVKLVDWCACGTGRIIDLYFDVAHALGITGVGQVVVRW